MQNQAPDSGSSLQQQQTGIQGNTPGLQQNSSPVVSDQTANVLNDYRSNQALTVQNQGQALPVSPPPAANTPAVPFVILALIIVPVCVALAIFWPSRKKQRMTQETVAATEVEEVPAQPVAVPKPKPTKGKKKQTRRQRASKQ